MGNPSLGEEIERYAFWKKSLEGYAHMGAMVHAAATLLSMRDAEISRLNSILESFAGRSPSQNYKSSRGEYKKPLGVYDPEFGDARLCKCGDTYGRHFDPYDNPEHEKMYGPAGCKYSQTCGCSGSVDNPSGFVDATGHQGYLPRTPEGHINNCLLRNEGCEEHPKFGPCQICNGSCPDKHKLQRGTP